MSKHNFTFDSLVWDRNGSKKTMTVEVKYLMISELALAVINSTLETIEIKQEEDGWFTFAIVNATEFVEYRVRTQRDEIKRYKKLDTLLEDLKRIFPKGKKLNIEFEY